MTASDFDGGGDIHFASEQIAVDHLTEEDNWGQIGTQLLCADCYAACSTGDHQWREHIAPPGTLGPEQTSERALRACSRCETIDAIKFGDTRNESRNISPSLAIVAEQGAGKSSHQIGFRQ